MCVGLMLGFRKYRYMEVNLQQRRKALGVKIPDIQQTLTVVQFLQDRRKKSKGEPVDEEPLSDDDDDDDDLVDDEDLGSDGGKKVEPLKTLFELNDTLYAEAEVEESGQVGIWLGVSHPSSSFHLHPPKAYLTIRNWFLGLGKLTTCGRQTQC